MAAVTAPSGRRDRRCRILGVLAAVYLAAAGAVTGVWLRRSGVEVSIIEMVVCALPAILAAVLAATSTEDRRQYAARVLACMLFTPILLLFWATSQDPVTPDATRAVWPFAVAASVGHALVFVGTIFIGGSFMTAVAPEAGVAPVGGADLHARLLSLRGAIPWLTLAAEGSDRINFAFQADAAARRMHYVILDVDRRRHVVRVRERLSASGARPDSPGEASMRGPGDAFFDPARPNAQRISGTTFQTTMVEPARLASMPVKFGARGVEIPEPFARELDGEGVLTLMCAVVARSGWQWQPVFWGGDGG